MHYIVNIVTNEGIGRSRTGGVLETHFVSKPKSKKEAEKQVAGWIERNRHGYASGDMWRPERPREEWWPIAKKVTDEEFASREWGGSKWADKCPNGNAKNGCLLDNGYHYKYARDLSREERLCSHCRAALAARQQTQRDITIAAVAAAFLTALSLLLAAI